MWLVKDLLIASFFIIVFPLIFLISLETVRSIHDFHCCPLLLRWYRIVGQRCRFLGNHFIGMRIPVYTWLAWNISAHLSVAKKRRQRRLNDFPRRMHVNKCHKSVLFWKKWNRCVILADKILFCIFLNISGYKKHVKLYVWLHLRRHYLSDFLYGILISPSIPHLIRTCVQFFLTYTCVVILYLSVFLITERILNLKIIEHILVE